MIEVRHAQVHELDDMLGVLTTAFRVSKKSWKPGFYAYPHDDIRNKRVVVKDGKVVSCLEFVPVSIYIGGTTVTMGGIAGVATLPNERRQGYSGMLMTDSVHALRELGFATSMLFPASYRFYRKFGWEYSSHYLKYSIKPEYLPASQEAARVRPFEDRDLPTILDIYAQKYAQRYGPFVHNERLWREDMMPRFRELHVYDNGGIQGYLVARRQPRKVFNIVEMLATTDESRQGLMGFLSTLSPKFALIKFLTCETDLHSLQLLNPRVFWQNEKLPVYKISIRPGLMFRITDLQEALKAILPRISGIDGELTIELQDEIGDWNNQPMTISSSGVKPGKTKHCLKANIRAFSQVYIGYQTPTQALSQGRIEVSSPQALEIADKMFPGSEPFIVGTDDF